MSRNDDISTRGGENAKRIALDRAVMLVAQLQPWGSMAKVYDAEYYTYGPGYEYDRDPTLAPKGVAEALLRAKWQGLLAGSDRTLV